MKRAHFYQLVKFVLRNITRIEYQGAENIPTAGGVIITTNHLSQIDTPLLMMNPTRPDITAVVTDKYQSFWFMRWFVNNAGGIWIDRTRADFTAFRAAIEALKQGQPLGIAPEGTRSTTGGLLQGKPGAILLALKADVPIVAVGIAGSETGFQQIRRLRRPHITARFGKPYRLPELGRENREEAMQAMTDEIMCHIAVLLPPEYRGFYADFPRVKELLAEMANDPAPKSVLL